MTRQPARVRHRCAHRSARKRASRNRRSGHPVRTSARSVVRDPRASAAWPAKCSADCVHTSTIRNRRCAPGSATRSVMRGSHPVRSSRGGRTAATQPITTGLRGRPVRLDDGHRRPHRPRPLVPHRCGRVLSSPRRTSSSSTRRTLLGSRTRVHRFQDTSQEQ